MPVYSDKVQDKKSQSIANIISNNQHEGKPSLQFKDNRPEAIAQRKLKEMADDYSSQQQQPLEVSEQAIQKKENNTGLPDNLKSGVENLSGFSMDDVKVHYNSDKPAQLHAHAYAQGTDIHLGSGQEKHLPHEAWHVVQQKQGRVKPTMQMKGGVNVNDDKGLEKEADVMGAKALQLKLNSAPLAQQIGIGNNNSVGLVQLFSNADIEVLNAIVPQPTPEVIAAINRFTLEQVQNLIPYTSSWDEMVQLAALNRNADEIVFLFNADPPPSLQHIIALDKISIADFEQIKQLANTDNWDGFVEAATRPVHTMEIAETSQQFFDEQTSLMDSLNAGFEDYVEHNPGRPLRIASFQFVRAEDGSLNINSVLKPIESLVAPNIESAFLQEIDGGANLIPEVRSNVTKTLFSAGQFQWIISNWESISHSHDIYVDVDYYPNRMADAGGVLHKDSVGETLFVNLTYNNAEAGASAEYVVDNEGYGPFEDSMPQIAKDLIAEKRAENADDDGAIKGVDLSQRGRTSFIDPAIWHATPLYNHRIPEIPFDDEAVGTIQQIIDYINDNRELNDRQRADALRVLDGQNPENQVTGAEAKSFFRQNEPLRYASRAGVNELVDTAPQGRRPRARSLDLTNHPEHMTHLEQQSAQARSFIRTWVILRPRVE